MVLFGLCVILIQFAAQIVAIPLALLQQTGEVALVICQILQHLWGQVVGAFVTCISGLFGLNILRQHPSPIGAMWNVGPHFLRVLGFQILILLVFIVIGGICAAPAIGFALMQDDQLMGVGIITSVVLAVPAVVFFFYFIVTFLLTNLFIIDRNCTIMEAMRDSATYMNGNRLTMFLIWLVDCAGAAGDCVVCCRNSLCRVPLCLVVFYNDDGRDLCLGHRPMAVLWPGNPSCELLGRTSQTSQRVGQIGRQSRRQLTPQLALWSDRHPQSAIRKLPSANCHPQTAIRNLTSAI